MSADVGHLVVWAMLTGGVTGGVWVGIVLVARQRRLAERGRALLEEIDERLEATKLAEVRLAEAEERLDHAERQLTRQRDGELRSDT